MPIKKEIIIDRDIQESLKKIFNNPPQGKRLMSFYNKSLIQYQELKNHTKIYLKFFDYGIEDFIPCEICEAKAVDIHHIERRGMGGSKDSDNINNLMALCRKCHDEHGDVPNKKEWLIKTHLKHIDTKLSKH